MPNVPFKARLATLADAGGNPAEASKRSRTPGAGAKTGRPAKRHHPREQTRNSGALAAPYPILLEAFLLSVLFLIVRILEKAINALIHGRTLVESLPGMGGGHFVGLMSVPVILFVAPIFGASTAGSGS